MCSNSKNYYTCLVCRKKVNFIAFFFQEKKNKRNNDLGINLEEKAPFFCLTVPCYFFVGKGNLIGEVVM